MTIYKCAQCSAIFESETNGCPFCSANKIKPPAQKKEIPARNPEATMGMVFGLISTIAYPLFVFQIMAMIYGWIGLRNSEEMDGKGFGQGLAGFSLGTLYFLYVVIIITLDTAKKMH